jgi:hypothetical protein
MISQAHKAKALKTRALLLAAGLSLVLTLPAFAQAAPAEDEQEQPAEEASTSEVSAPSVNDEDVLKDIDVSQLDWGQLNVDVSTLSDGPAAKARQARAAADGGMNWSNNNRANGSSAVSVKQSVSPFLDTRVGADMTVTREPTTMSELLAEKTANGGALPQSGGSAWAAITAPGAGPVWDKTAVEARVDPGADQSRLGTSISKQVPLTDGTSVTLSNGYNVTQQGTVPVPGIASRQERSYQTDQSAKVELSDTGTSVSAGQTLSTTDDKWLRKIGAEQKLFGGVSVSGSVSETPQGTINKSISAGIKKSW